MTKARDKQVYEILEEVQAAKTTIERTTILRQNYSDHQPLMYILKWNFDNTLQSVLPEGDAPVDREERDGPAPSSLWQYLKVFPRFVDCPVARQTAALRRESLFLEMLENIDAKEAEVIIHAKDKNLDSIYDKVTIDVVQQVFPDLISEPTEAAPPQTNEEKADELKAYAETLKKQAKDLNTEAKELIAQSKKVLEA
jgi:hypothetical protein